MLGNGALLTAGPHRPGAIPVDTHRLLAPGEGDGEVSTWKSGHAVEDRGDRISWPRGFILDSKRMSLSVAARSKPAASANSTVISTATSHLHSGWTIPLPRYIGLTIGMNPTTMTRQAIRSAQREGKKRGRTLTKYEVLKLHIQTVSPRARALFITAGIVAGAIAALCYSANGPWWVTVLFASAAAVQLGFGVFGRKAQIEREMKKLTGEKIADAVLTGILDGIA
jgi:hypothetical protein